MTGYTSVQIACPGPPDTRVDLSGASYVVWGDESRRTLICLSGMTGNELRMLARHLDEFSHEVDAAYGRGAVA